MRRYNCSRGNIHRKGFSYTDAVTVVVANTYDINHFLSYGTRSFTGLIENINGPGYWDTLPGNEKKRILMLLKRSQKRRH